MTKKTVKPESVEHIGAGRYLVKFPPGTSSALSIFVKVTAQCHTLAQVLTVMLSPDRERLLSCEISVFEILRTDGGSRTIDAEPQVLAAPAAFIPNEDGSWR